MTMSLAKFVLLLDTNVESLVSLGSRFKIPNVLAQCEKFLKYDSDLPFGRKLVLAQLFQLDDLKVGKGSLFLMITVKPISDDVRQAVPFNR
jgi:hypothetical protein